MKLSFIRYYLNYLFLLRFASPGRIGVGLGSSAARSPKSLNGELSLLQQHGLCILGHHPTYIEFLFSFVPSVPKSNFSEPEQLRVRYILYCTNRIDSFFQTLLFCHFFRISEKGMRMHIWQAASQVDKQAASKRDEKWQRKTNWRSFEIALHIWLQRTNGKLGFSILQIATQGYK